MNKRNLRHWAVLLAVIVGIGGVVLGMHQIDQQDKQEVAATNHRHARQTHAVIAKAAAISRQQRNHQKTAFDKANSGKSAPKFSAHLRQELKNRKFVGTALVVKKGHVVYQQAFGMANAQHHKKNTVRSQFMINSVQKSMTGMLVMKAAQTGQLQLTDKLSQYYPSISGSQRVTIRQMLNMEAGIVGQLRPATTLTENEVYKYASQNAKVDAKKIGKFDYQPICYALLAGILHQVTHDSYYELFYQQLVTPLNLNHTSFAQLRTTTKGMTVGYAGAVPRDYSQPHKPAAANLASQLATGNATMSAGDVFRAERAIISGSLLTTKAGADVLHERQQSIHYAGGMYHLDNQRGYYGHGMGDDYESTFVMSHDGQTGVVFLSNNFEKKTMYPEWSTEKLAMATFDHIMKPMKLK
ncbi:serine hydrolase domain-containing protein [Levilactobacillus brevis]|uniref:Beta-lactamase class C related penicillin binding protein n=1 Tax=Levilactobacillus brevis (strain ATCC 367 / BCRC 12310 / CIP 105137 / JCM 1170 / LMG 11437 / NCIMB 947 / NCTC 947) TaxID=387344 RepID=Q03SV5_LEVBA|nr:serine hydrolase domain-containing protein [Levilactobacillus brevis]MBL3537087.1 serine hydrolase [Lactobacillus sp. GPR40-2]MBL3630166.1 serine hydrolase [Lactobacillus sp. GPB7-4]ABJ63717.1 Beta-lactamase class C related penicillin binding protein [Levilactobacillus brevis ATCC 367]ARQ93460.1 penicillin-binding protein [Levilactobacillus brevis]ARW21484.1 Serine-type D-Ala-D-Ala carboxypeptidase [Levilactobacillus brevis]